jgi:hypothetical protein
MRSSRRGFLAGLGAFLATPAIVHAGNIMPVRTPRVLVPRSLTIFVDQAFAGGFVNGSRENPFRTLQDALAFLDKAGAGGTIQLASGTYNLAPSSETSFAMYGSAGTNRRQPA